MINGRINHLVQITHSRATVMTVAGTRNHDQHNGRDTHGHHNQGLNPTITMILTTNTDQYVQGNASPTSVTKAD